MDAPSSTDRIEKQIQINAPIALVWDCLTDHKEFGAWFGVRLESPFIPGKETRGRITYPGYEHLTMQIITQKIEPQTCFSYLWHPYAVDPNADYSKEKPTLVEFRLQPKNGGTLLRVTESGFDAIPIARRDEAFRMNDGGWTDQLTRIARYATGN